MGWFSKEDDRSEELQNHHNQGQEDASNDEHSQPHGAIAEFFGYALGGDELRDEMREDNEAYEKGHDNTENQR